MEQILGSAYNNNTKEKHLSFEVFRTVLFVILYWPQFCLFFDFKSFKNQKKESKVNPDKNVKSNKKAISVNFSNPTKKSEEFPTKIFCKKK